MDQISELQEKHINDIALKLGFVNYSIEATKGSSKGDGYLSVVYFVTITENNSLKQLNLALKAGHKSKDLREQLPLRSAYLRESYVYDQIFPQFLKFQGEYNIQEPFDAIPKCYGALDEEFCEALFLENIRMRRFTLWNRKVPMNREHVELALKTYAKFHAVSLALSDLRPKMYKELSETLPDLMYTEELKSKVRVIWDSVIKRGYVALGDHPAKSLLKQLDENYSSLYELCKIKSDDLYVAVHGDCWCNNMMFRYNEVEIDLHKPLDICILDWQVCRIGSPAYDISYFLFANADKSILDDFENLIEIYYAQLSKNLEDFGCVPENIFPKELLWEHIGVYSVLGVLASFFILEHILRDSEDTIDFEELANAGKNVMDEFGTGDVDAKVADEYNKRIRNLITFLYEKNVLNFSRIEEKLSGKASK